jgi:hypothetical protein
MQTKKSSYRLRVCQLSDGSIQLVFGSDVIDPTWKVLSDHDVTEVVTVTDHIPSVQS